MLKRPPLGCPAGPAPCAYGAGACGCCSKLDSVCSRPQPDIWSRHGSGKDFAGPCPSPPVWTVGPSQPGAQAPCRALALKCERARTVRGCVGKQAQFLLCHNLSCSLGCIWRPAGFHSLSLFLSVRLPGNSSLSKPTEVALFTTFSGNKLVGQGETHLVCPLVFFEFLPNLSIKTQPQAGFSLNRL